MEIHDIDKSEGINFEDFKFMLMPDTSVVQPNGFSNEEEYQFEERMKKMELILEKHQSQQKARILDDGDSDGNVSVRSKTPMKFKIKECEDWNDSLL